MTLEIGASVVWANSAEAAAAKFGPGPFTVAHRTTKPLAPGRPPGAYLTLQAPDGHTLPEVEFPEEQLEPYAGESFEAEDIVDFLDAADQRVHGVVPGPWRIAHVYHTGKGIFLTLTRIGASPAELHNVPAVQVQLVCKP
jgi:hypothetical protein